MALELAALGGHFFSGFPITADWKKKQIEQGLPAIVGLSRPTQPTQLASSPERSSMLSTEEVVEPVKEAVDNVLRESLRSQRDSKRSSAFSAVLNKKKKKQIEPGERVLVSGWLTKRANLRPFQDSWQARWCEVSQFPQGHGVLRYSAPLHEAPGQMQLKGEIHLAPSTDTQVMSFEEAASKARSTPSTVSGYLEYWARPNAESIIQEFQHGFLLQTAKEGTQAGRIFYFVTERESESRRWVGAIQSILQKPQSLEDFLGEDLGLSFASSQILDDKDSFRPFQSVCLFSLLVWGANEFLDACRESCNQVCARHLHIQFSEYISVLFHVVSECCF